MEQRTRHLRPLPVIGCVLASLICLPLSARAQIAPPAIVSPLPHIAPVSPPDLGAGLPNFQSSGSEGALPPVSVPVASVAVIGATAFPPAQLDGLTAGLTGPSVPLSKIEAARLALVSLYRHHGFVLTTVSLDIDNQGNVHFIVTEGRIVAVKLSKDIGPAGTRVLAFLDHLTEERPVNEASLERWLLLAQQIPGVSVHAVLQSEGGDPGALTLVAEVSKQTVSGLITADNRSFEDTGPEEVLGVADLNSLTSYGDQSEVSIFHTAGNTDNFGQASESFYLGDDGLRLKLYGGAGRAHPGGTLRQAAYESAITVFGGELAYPVILKRDQALTAKLRFDAIQANIYLGDARNSSDSLRVARVSSEYALQDLLAGNSRQALNIVNLQASKGIPAFGASPDGRPAGVAGRAGERIDFWKINGSVGRTQTLFSPYPAASVALRLEAGGQFTTQILPSEEEYYLGGSRFNRGFYSGEAVGDKAAYATAELQFNTGYDFTAFSHDVDLGVQLYGFYDWGEAWPNLKSDLSVRLASAGGGIRFGLTRYIEVDGEAVERLTTRLIPGASTPPLRQTIVYWGVLARY